MARTTVPFTNFAFGEYGLQSPFGVGFAIYRQHLLYKGWWSGRNVMRTIDGGLCPRWEPVQQAFSSAPANAIVRHAGIGYSANGAVKLWVINDSGSSSDVYTTTVPGPGAWSSLGTLAGVYSAADYFDSVNAGEVSYFCTSGQGTFSLDHTTGTITGPFSPQRSGRCITFYGARLMVGGESNGSPNPNRIWFSGSATAPADVTTWLSTNYIDVGDASTQILGMWPLRNFLVIAKGPLSDPTRASGRVTEWWILAGVPSVNAVLRRVSSEPTVRQPWAGVVLADNRMIGFGREGMFEPASFNGTAVTDERFLNQSPQVLPRAGRLKEPGDWMLSDGKSALVFRENAWTRHDSFDTYGAAALPATIPYAPLVLSDRGTVYLLNSTMVAVASWNPSNQRPAFVSDAAAGGIPNPANVAFTLPEWWARDATESQVAAVIVDFRKFATGDTNPNQFTVTATPLRSYLPPGDGGGTSDGAGTSGTFSEPPSSATTAGARGRLVARIKTGWGNGFRIDFSGMRGVTIDKVVVVVDTRDVQGI